MSLERRSPSADVLPVELGQSDCVLKSVLSRICLLQCATEGEDNWASLIKLAQAEAGDGLSSGQASLPPILQFGLSCRSTLEVKTEEQTVAPTKISNTGPPT